MKKYTVLSFNFNGYDKLREPLSVDPNADYVFVTDKPTKSKYWNVIVDTRLANRNPIYAAYYVRWHPFEYVKTDIVIVIDASIKINSSLSDIYVAFANSGADYAPMCSVYKNDEEKIAFWHKSTKRIDSYEVERLTYMIDKLHQSLWKGSVGMAIGLIRNTFHIQHYMKHVWRYLLALGRNGVPHRLDEVIAHKVLWFYNDVLDIFPLSVQVIQSNYMTYCEHKSDTPVNKYPDYDQYFYLCNKPVSPVRFDKSINFPTSYRFHTEAVLLTKYLNPDDLKEWLDHHLDRVKFDHVHIFDNESSYNVRAVCDLYGDRVSYQKVYGQARQYRLYDAYINNISDAEWVMPIDDDEYLDIGDFDSVYDAIQYYQHKLPHMMILGVRWKHMFPEKFHTERTGLVLEYCTKENPELAKTFMHLGDTTVKCIVKRYGNIHYEETWENQAGGHVPKHTCYYGAVMCDGRAVLGCGIPNCPDHLDDERIRLLHCRYKGLSDYAEKMSTAMTVSDSVQRKKKWQFDEILPHLC